MTTLRMPVAQAYVPLMGDLRYKGADGGRASAKSHFFGDEAIDYCVSHPGLRMVCIREVQKTLKRSSKLLLEDKIKYHNKKNPGLVEYFDVMRDEIRFANDGLIIFQGMQDHTADSIKSLEGFDVFWVEEAQNLSSRSLDLLRPTARRTPRSVLPQPQLWFSWNRKHPDDPVDVFFRDLDATPNGTMKPAYAHVSTTFADNPWFPPELRAEMEWDKRRNPEKYAHVWLGGYLMRSEARVFNNWRVDEFDVPANTTFFWGADWGFSVDPSVLIGCFIVGRTLFICYEAWKVGCEIEDLPELFDSADPEREGFARKWTITADSERPDTISFMRRHGYPRIVGARKGAGSVEDGIEFVKNYDIVVHPRCVHVIDELTHFSYKVDKQTEQVLPILEDKKNHTIDAVRYAVEDVRWQVQGAMGSHPSEVAARYDGSITKIERPVVPAGTAFDASVVALDGHEYDGGLT